MESLLLTSSSGGKRQQKYVSIRQLEDYPSAII